MAPDRLRFDFSHFAALSEEEIAQVEDLVNSRVLADEPVQVIETSMHEAEELGAIAFFGDKYGDTVRVVEAGEESIELCGGTHVSALGMIGPLVIVSEGSIGSNTRRVEALTGSGSLARLRELGRTLDRSAELLRAAPAEVPEAIDRLVKRERASEEELRALRAREMRSEARQLAANALEGAGRDGGSAPAAKARLVARRDGLAADQLRELALAVRSEEGIEAAALVGSPDGARVALVVAVEPGSGLEAGRLAGEAARAVGGGGGGRGDVATAGGSDIAGIDAAIGLLEQAFATNGASSDRPGARTAG